MNAIPGVPSLLPPPPSNPPASTIPVNSMGSPEVPSDSQKPEPRVLGGREITDQRGKSRIVGPFYCSVCHKQFPHKSLTEIHLQCHMEKRLPCPFCDKMFKNKYVLKYHVEGAHNQTVGEPSPQLRRRLEKRSLNTVTCFCGISFETMNSYNEHMRTHQHHGPGHAQHEQRVACHPCPMCKETFNDLYHLVKHMEIHNNNRPSTSPERPLKRIVLSGGATLQLTAVPTARTPPSSDTSAFPSPISRHSQQEQQLLYLRHQQQHLLKHHHNHNHHQNHHPPPPPRLPPPPPPSPPSPPSHNHHNHDYDHHHQHDHHHNRRHHHHHHHHHRHNRHQHHHRQQSPLQQSRQRQEQQRQQHRERALPLVSCQLSCAEPKRRSSVASPSPPRLVWQCEVCEDTFSHLAVLRGHMQNKHHLYLVCLECHRFLNDVDGMAQHMKSDHPDVAAHPCPVCGRCFSDEEAAKSHLDAHKNGLADFSGCFQCSFCEALFDAERECALHENAHRSEVSAILS